MGYFSELNLEIKENHTSRGYYSVENQLVSRFSELKDRYFNLLSIDAPYTSEDFFTHQDFCYAPVECFESIEDVYRALEATASAIDSSCDIATANEIRNELKMLENQERRKNVNDNNDSIQLEITFMPLLLKNVSVA